MNVHKQLFNHFVGQYEGVVNVSHLDIGSHTKSQMAIRLSPSKPENLLSCEIDEELISDCKKPCFYGNILDMFRFVDRKFDLITAFDVIEHLTKEDGKVLIEEVEHACPYGIIIFATPNGDWCVGAGKKYHSHLCGWNPQEFIDRGYDVLLFPKMHDTGWFYAIKDADGLVKKPTIPQSQSENEQWVWMEGRK